MLQRKTRPQRRRFKYEGPVEPEKLREHRTGVRGEPDPGGGEEPVIRAAGYIPWLNSEHARDCSVGTSLYTEDVRRLFLPWIPVSKKNRTRIKYVDPLVRRDTERARLAVLQGCPPCNNINEFRIRVRIFRRTPEEEATGKRNSRRGDLTNMSALICDALQGLWWADDEQITKEEVEEFRCQKFNAFTIEAWRRHL